jgi:hypothetical protein
MHIGEISFCGSTGYNIKSDELKQTILDEISEKYNKKIIEKHYERFSDNSYNILNSRPYIMSLRSNGNPYFLYLTKIGNVNQCVFIDKKIQIGYIYPRMVLVKLWFDKRLFKNTLFEGEMVKSDDKWLFLLHDMFVEADNSLKSYNIVKRYNMMYNILKNEHTISHQDICVIQIKKLFKYEEADKIIAYSKTLPYTCRGIYFMPLYYNFKQILYNFNDELICKKQKLFLKPQSFQISSNNDNNNEKERKLKRSVGYQLISQSCASSSSSSTDTTNNMTRIMYLQKTTIVDVYKVFGSKTGSSESIGIAFVNTTKVSNMLRERFLNTTPVDKLPFKCCYKASFKKWAPLCDDSP